MGFKRNVSFLGFFRPLGASGHRNLLDRSPGGPRRLHSRLSLLRRRLISNDSLSRRSSRIIPLRLLVITARGNMFYTTRKKESKYSDIIELAEHLRCHEVEEFNTFF
jgi:hypothetical protein